MTVLTYPHGHPIDWTKARLTDMVQWDRAASDGVVVRGSLFTIAWLDWLDSRARHKFGHGVQVIQPCFHTGVPASAGTHDGDGCLDISLPGVDWWTAQKFVRSHYGWGWFRYPPLFSYHIHCGPVGLLQHGLRVGIFVPGQIVDYNAKAFGLASQHTPGSDHSWGPKNRQAVWPYAAYIEEMVSNMPLTDGDVAKVVQALLDAEVGPKTDRQTVRNALYQGANISAKVLSKVQAIHTKITGGKP